MEEWRDPHQVKGSFWFSLLKMRLSLFFFGQTKREKYWHNLYFFISEQKISWSLSYTYILSSTI